MSGITFKMEVILMLLLGTIAMTTGSNIYIVNKFEIDSTKGAFSHMVLNKKTGNVYTGAMNNLYQLSSNLTLIKSATTGPKYDNPDCKPQYTTASCYQPKKPMNAYNKALVIDYNNNKLIACSSLYHGICERYSLSDIELKSPDSYVPVVGNNATSTTVAFIAPGPKDGVRESHVLYVAASRTNAGQSVFRDLVPAIASRKLENFDLFYKGIGTSSSKSIEAMLRDTFPVYYIYGFGSDKFSYFVTVQTQNPTTESYISKLIRVCQADKDYYSYAEVQLKCMHSGTLYNLVQAAYVGKAGSSLTTTMGISEHEDVLYVVCSIGNLNTAIPGSDSALCVYPLRTVRRIFTENIKACFDGIGNTGPSHIISQAPCLKTKFNISDDYCGTYDINTPIDGQIPIQAEAAITFNTTVSAVAVTTEFQDTIVFVGTVKGHIIKVAVKSGQMATSYEDVTVEDGSKIHADMFFDSDRRHLYALTDRKIYKLKVQECKQYTTCKSCLGATDPYCGWCSLESKCSQREECESHEQDLRWLSSGHACITITHVVPDKIQKEHQKTTQEGDTRVTALHVISDIKFRFATTMVSSRMKSYVNETRKAVFNVTMPNEAFITEFLLEIGGVIYPGEIKDKRTARDQFENAMSMGQTAGYVGTRERETNQFFVEVSLAAYDKVTFNLTYQELLTRKRGRYDHQIYVDAGRNVDDMSISVSVLEFKDIELFEVYTFGNKIETSPVDIRIEEQDPSMTAIFKTSPNARRVQYIPSLEDRRKGLTGQFVVRYDVERNHDNGDLLVVGGHFIHFFAPAGSDPIPRNVIFILDISGSMFGDKIKQLKSAMHVILDDLNPNDQFNILTFSSGTTKWRKNIVRNTVENINDAKTFVDTLEADGGTNIYDALDEGLILAAIASKNSMRCTIIFFLTDGEPTDGAVTDKTEIMTRVQKMNQDRNKTPIFTLAFGYDADYKLMRKIALQNYGLARRVYEAGDAENQISGFYQEIRNVLLKDVSIIYSNSIEESSLTRTKFPNYFVGTEKVVAGKIKNSVENDPIVEVHFGTANVNRQPPLVLVLGAGFDMPSFLNLTNVADLEEILEKSWAYLSVKQLLEDSESSVDDTEKGRINRQILDLSLRYSFVTPLTSMVVTKPPEAKEKEKEDEGIQYPREDNSKPDDVQESRLIDDTRTDSSARNGIHSDLYSDDFDTVLDRPIQANNDPSLMVTVAHLHEPLCFNSLGNFDHSSAGIIDVFTIEDGVIEIQAELENKDVLSLTAIFVKTKSADLILRSWSVFDRKTGRTSNWRNLTFGDVTITKEESQLDIKVGNIEFSLERMDANKLRIIVNHSYWNVPKDTIPTGILGEMLSKVFAIKYAKDNGSVRIRYPDIDNDRGAKVNLHSLKTETEKTVSRKCYMVKTNQRFFFEDFRRIPRKQIKQ